MTKAEGAEAPLRVIHSVVSGAELGRRLAAIYDLRGEALCTLYRRGFNDVYFVTPAGGPRLVARLSGPRHRGPPNTEHETALLTHLHGQGAKVAAPIPGRDGALWRQVQAPEGPRHLVLFPFLDGVLPMIDPGNVALMGSELARIHTAAESYDGPPSLYRLDADHLVRRPAARIAAAPSLDDTVRAEAAALAEQTAARLEALTGLTQGACHGDCHGWNTHICTDGTGQKAAMFFDFDDGGPGPVAYDLAAYLWNILQQLGVRPFEAVHRAVWDAFIGGYRQRRPISEADMQAIPAYVQARHLWFLGEFAARSAFEGTEVFRLGWVRERLAAARAWDAALRLERL